MKSQMDVINGEWTGFSSWTIAVDSRLDRSVHDEWSNQLNEMNTHSWMEWNEGWMSVTQVAWNAILTNRKWQFADYCKWIAIDSRVRKFHCELVESWMEWYFHTAENCSKWVNSLIRMLCRRLRMKWVRMQMHSFGIRNGMNHASQWMRFMTDVWTKQSVCCGSNTIQSVSSGPGDEITKSVNSHPELDTWLTQSDEILRLMRSSISSDHKSDHKWHKSMRESDTKWMKMDPKRGW